jgi:hypothetical protein
MLTLSRARKEVPEGALFPAVVFVGQRFVSTLILARSFLPHLPDTKKKLNVYD